MIRYDDINNLEGEQAERIFALIDRGSEIGEMPDDLATVAAWEKHAADCEAEGLPHYAASARFNQFSIYCLGGRPVEALESFARLMQLVARYGDYIAPANVAAFLGSVSSVTANVVEEPSISRDQAEQVIDLVEAQLRARGLELSNVYLARAELATEFGDEAAMQEWRHRWLAEGSPDWPPLSADTVGREIAMIALLNPAEAISVLSSRFSAMGVRPGPIDLEHPEARLIAMLRVRLAWLYARTGRRDVAATLGDELLNQFTAQWLSRNTILEEVLVALEHRPQEALVVADYALNQITFGPTEWRLLAALARNRILADPQGAEGRLLQQIALEGAAAHGERGNTDLHPRELGEFWLAGLPEGPRPQVIDTPAIWSDTASRAEQVLRAGWLQRISGVSSKNSPIGMREKYVELALRPNDIFEAETAEAAAALAAQIRAEAADLKYPSSLFASHLILGFHASELGDYVAFVEGYAAAQQEMLVHHDSIDLSLRQAAEGAFVSVVEVAVSEPRISLARIHEIIDTERTTRELTGGPSTPLVQGQAELAAHLGDGDALQQLVGDVVQRSQTEERDVDRMAVFLEVVRLTWQYAPDYAESLAGRVLSETNDPAQRRVAQAWAGWFGMRKGGQTHVDDVLTMLESVDRDVSEFGSIPTSVIVELATQRPDALPWVIEAALADASPGAAVEVDTFAAVAKVLLERFPADERGPRLRDEVLRIAADLDARNGNTVQSTMIGQRWFPALASTDQG